uniref:Radical_SAM domain-containing protein n=1 Tax=Steinernema glaseri TaxID=37863 RepID=A0A1I8ACN3_9BILA
MDSVPNVFIERVTGILCEKTVRVLREGQVILGRWAFAHPTYKELKLTIATFNGKKFCSFYLKEEDLRNVTLANVFSMWNMATCNFIAVKFYATPVVLGEPLKENHFRTLKKMIAQQRRRISLLYIGPCEEELLDNAVDILELCGGVEQLRIDTNMTRIAPVVNKLISDGGVCEFMLFDRIFPDHMIIPTLTTQIEFGNLRAVYRVGPKFGIT